MVWLWLHNNTKLGLCPEPELELQQTKRNTSTGKRNSNIKCPVFYFHIQHIVLTDRHRILFSFTRLVCCQRLYKMSGEDNVTDYDDILVEIQRIQSRNVSENATQQHQLEMKMIYLITYSIVLILGVTLNFIVIVFSCLKNKNSPKVATWIVALAATHLVCSASTVFQLLYAYNNFIWIYGSASCKLSSYIVYGSMFSTAAMLSLWSISFTFSKCECTKNCKNCNIILILLSWTIAAVLACPSLFSREIRESQCIDDYDLDKSRTTQDGMARLKTVVIMRFLIGVLVPALTMFLSCLTSANRSCKDCKKQDQIICAIKIVYFVFWGPQIVLTMIQATANDSLGSNTLKYGFPAATVLATSHSFTNPIIYLLLGCSIKMNWIAHDPDQCEMEVYQGITLLPLTRKAPRSNTK
ncbi:chemerin-like receptor 1 [Garra rufa]|uniref:chemerin-like receptor 1 n=1 Tax=Garra rufa TaxID=137080 RepID=UPI003CCEA40A